MASVNYESEIRVKEVYDLAYDIAQEFDKLVRIHDIEVISPLINKVIHVLEILETRVDKIGCLEKEIAELKLCLKQLSAERSANEHEKSLMKQTFEETEESWQQEFANLKANILKLKTENKLLRGQLSNKNEESSEIGNSYETVIQDQEDYILQLKSNVQHKEKLLQKDVMEIDALKSEIEELLDVNKSLHACNEEAKSEVHRLRKDRKAYELQLSLQEQKIISLEQNLEEYAKCHFKKFVEVPMKDKKFLENEDHGLNFQERENLLEEINHLQLQLNIVKKQNEMYQRKVLKLTDQNSSRSCEKSSIRQLFHLFLGVIAIAPKSCWF